MTNLEKVKELKDYQQAQILAMLELHVSEVGYLLQETNNKDSKDASYRTEKIIVSWLNEHYDEEKGFRFLNCINYIYINLNELDNLKSISRSMIDIDLLIAKRLEDVED